MLETSQPRRACEHWQGSSPDSADCEFAFLLSGCVWDVGKRAFVVVVGGCGTYQIESLESKHPEKP